ncbi:hypothetical protein [Legionella brunensis]|uniref:Uncharacterized protein n=1 Tax=Legionella brunensis TaxID=29422 RepID=A0A0W0SV40_9GAMM|nr:hypothetical protein [Legionella brunensis]KTC87218.1 hypothetical protein Lbru_0036 [Legionella brunensis]
MAVFFDKNANSPSAYNKLRRTNEHATREKRIVQAEEALQALQQEIDNRTVKLIKIRNFSETQHALYKQLTKKHENTPSNNLAKQLSRLKRSLETLDNKLEQAQKVITDLHLNYEQLKSELAEKMATAALPSENGMP